MKISKLFHWLYAILMFLPVIAIGSTILVNVFNKNSSYEPKINYKYETNEVETIADLKQGNIYTYKANRYTSETDKLICYASYVEYEYQNSNNNYLIIVDKLVAQNISLEYWSNQTNKNLCIRYYGTTSYVNNNLQEQYIHFVYQNDFNEEFLDNIYPCENIPIESVDTQESNSNGIDNKFYDAINRVEQSSIFNWAMSSFLVTPFSYIVGLFGMPSNNIVVLLLSYWLDISIIWLVFDLVMYVPLLVHRWIDKAGIE